MNEDNPPPAIIPINLRIPLIASLFIGALWLGVLALALLLPGNGDGDYKAMFGQLGDAFGMMNSLVGGLTIAFALYTISQNSEMMRNQEAQHQRERLDAKNAVITSKAEECGCKLSQLVAELIDVSIPILGEVPKSHDDMTPSIIRHTNALLELVLVSEIHFPEIRPKISALIDTAYHCFSLPPKFTEAMKKEGITAPEVEKLKKEALDKISEASDAYADVTKMLIQELRRIQSDTKFHTAR